MQEVDAGAQLKTTHNLRLVSADILNFCRHLPQPSMSTGAAAAVAAAAAGRYVELHLYLRKSSRILPVQFTIWLFQLMGKGEMPNLLNDCPNQLT